MSAPSGISHIAVVTADLDGFRAFYEDTIGLETTVVLGAGLGHDRQAVIIAGDVMLHVFEMPGYEPAAHGVAPAMFERGRLDHFGFTVSDEAALRALGDRLLAVGASSGEVHRLGPMLSIRFQDPTAATARSTASTWPTTPRRCATRTRSWPPTGSSGPGRCCAPTPPPVERHRRPTIVLGGPNHDRHATTAADDHPPIDEGSCHAQTTEDNEPATRRSP